MSRPQPAFTQIDAQRLINAAMACGLKNYKLIYADRELSLIVTDAEKLIEVPISKSDDNEPEPKA